mmetsp:Transcript_22443/g.45227  ORF Transcript_22443/g.45227 Transcript_22443/m.45227 type:complete len:138 (+) Transcript_22443:412-825(+)
MMREAWKSVQIVLIAPPPIDAEKWDAKRGGPGMGERTLDHVQQYSKRCTEVAARLGCPCIDTYNKFLEDSSWKGLLDDGLHFSEGGNARLHALLTKVIEEQCPELTPAAIPAHLPLNADIDQAEYRKILLPTAHDKQ